MSTQAIVQLRCEVSDCTVEYKDGKMVIIFEREVDYNPDVVDKEGQLGDIQSDMLWECFDSTLEVIEVKDESQLSLVVDHHENVSHKTLKFQSAIIVSKDEAWEWANQQSGATINDIYVDDETLGLFVYITPQWNEDVTTENLVQYEQDFYDYFADKMQE